jgi:hypothetical protein
LVTGLVAFAAVAAVAGLLGVGLGLRRVFLVAAFDATALAAMGADRRQQRGARFVGTLPFIAVGTSVAIAMALVLGGLEPVGSLKLREPHPGWHANVALLVASTLLTALALGAVAWFASGRPRRNVPHQSRNEIVRRIVGNAPPTIGMGTRFALEPGAGRTAVPVRSAIIGASVAVAGVVAVCVYAASLNQLVQTPARWGWVADARVVDAQPDDIDRLAADPRVSALSSTEEVRVAVDDHETNGEALTPEKGVVGWTVLEGRMPERAGEVLLGSRFARDVDRSVGDRVLLQLPRGGTTAARVVGIGSGPNVNNSQFANDVLIASDDVATVGLTAPFRGAAVTFAPEVDADEATQVLGPDLEVNMPRRPAGVDNLAQLGTLPTLLGAFLAMIVAAVLAHVLATATRRRRRDLDVLAAIGLVPRQVRGVVQVAALVTVGIGLGIGIPLGIVVGRLTWQATARSVYVAPDGVLPVALLTLVALGAIAVAVVVAAWAGFRVSRRPVAAGLHEE